MRAPPMLARLRDLAHRSWAEPQAFWPLNRRILALRPWLAKRYHGQRLEAEVGRGARFAVDFIDHIEFQLFFFGAQLGEIGNLKVLPRLLDENSVFVDVGANVGSYSLLVAPALQHGRVFAFEPASATRRRLQDNINRSAVENVTVFPLALDQQPGRRTIHVPPGQWRGKASFFLDPTFPPEFDIEEAACDTLDAVANREGWNRIDLIKIDVEGAELAVLRGGRRVLGRFRPAVLFEHFSHLVAAAGDRPQDYFDLLEGLNYRLHNVTPNGDVVAVDDPQALPERAYVLACPDERPVAAGPRLELWPAPMREGFP